MIVATSPNGWPVSPNPADIDVVPLSVGTGSAEVQFSTGVRGGKVFQVLAYVANALHTRVQRASSTLGCGGYSFRPNVNDPTVWSNHASATAFDYNWVEHPNGEPAVENWTPVQIEEIHKILDEVDGAVRWGGDYVTTPDPMHFEINVTPEQLEGMPLPKVGHIGPLGVFDESGIGAELTEMSVSYPTLAAYMHYAHWRFTATKTGRISIDALLSHYVDPNEGDEHGPQVELYVYKEDFTGASWTGSSTYYNVLEGDQFAPMDTDFRNQGRILLNAVAGETYVIQTTADPNYPWIRTVVRIGDYGPEPNKWVQPPNQVRTWAYSDGNMGTDVTDPGAGNVLKSGTGFQGGRVELHRAFGGPDPAMEPDAIECSWHWSRYLYVDSGYWYWSITNGASWNNTDPFNPAVPGYGTCPNLSGWSEVPSWYYGGSVGHWYQSTVSDFGFHYQDIKFKIFGASWQFEVAKVIAYEGFDGTGPDPVDYLPEYGPTDILEWESDHCELTGVRYAWDDRANQNLMSADPVDIKWYAGDCDAARPAYTWGPEPGISSAWYGQGGSTADGWVGSQDHLGDTTGGGGSWHPLAEKYWDGTIPRTRFTALPADLFSDTAPEYAAGTKADTSTFLQRLTGGQYIALETTVKPSRYRIIPDPGIPDLPWAGVNAITINQTDDGRVLY